MWPEDLFDFVLADLAEEITTAKIIIAQPMPCDRWIARSALQKAIRRGEAGIALTALARLMDADGDAIWRHRPLSPWRTSVWAELTLSPVL